LKLTVNPANYLAKNFSSPAKIEIETPETERPPNGGLFLLEEGTYAIPNAIYDRSATGPESRAAIYPHHLNDVAASLMESLVPPTSIDVKTEQNE
jgi:hypothetical protein